MRNDHDAMSAFINETPVYTWTEYATNDKGTGHD